jgi:copper oxidase (laccase) domain-containing protein
MKLITGNPSLAFESLPPPFLKEVQIDLEATTVFSSAEMFEKSPGFSLGAGSVHYSLDHLREGAFGVQAYHSNVVVEPAFPFPKGDGLWSVVQSNVSALSFGIKTADCLAVALISEIQGWTFIALVHAGWRGYAGGIHMNTLNCLLKRGQELGISEVDVLKSVHAHISPAIFGNSYECGADVEQAIELHEQHRLQKLPKWPQMQPLHSICRDVSNSVPRATEYLNSESPKIFPDLQLLMACDLLSLEIPEQNISLVRENTFGHELLPSYRESSLQGVTMSRRLVTHVRV